MQLNHSLLAAEKQPYKPIELYAIKANTTNVVKAPVNSSSGLYICPRPPRSAPYNRPVLIIGSIIRARQSRHPYVRLGLVLQAHARVAS